MGPKRVLYEHVHMVLITRVFPQTHPFSSTKKRMSVVVRHGNGFRLYVKGASEILLPLCVSQATANAIEPLSDGDKVGCTCRNGWKSCSGCNDRIYW